MDTYPRNLEDVFRVMRDWQSMHTETHLGVIPGQIPLLNLGLSLPHDINAYSFSRYVSRYLMDRKLNVVEHPIRMPFLPKHTANDEKDSVDIFKLILAYMFDHHIDRERHLIMANYIIQKGLSNEMLRDEIYIQLINQTMGQSPGPADSQDSAWVLMASCLSTFPPSTHLAKHLLKYVSDAGVNGFDAVCQHKLLQCLGLEPELVRTYPPCLLEWTTNRKRAAMAFNAGFADGEQGVSQVESWTTGEQFAANIFHSRHIQENLTGWSVQLRDDVDTYECAGYDYVVDLISEMELPPSFPCSTAYFLATTDMSRPASTVGRQHWPDEPHSAERVRLMPLEVDELPDQPVVALPPPVSESPPPPPVPANPPPPQKKPSVVETPRPPTPKEPESPAHIRPEDIYKNSDGAISQGSALNKRKDQIPEELSKKSVLNSRYGAGSTGSSTNGARKVSEPEQAKPSRQKTPTPEPPPVRQQPKQPPVEKQKPRPQQPPPEKKPEKPQEEDMSAWVDNVFRQALSAGPVQDLGNAQAVSGKMKGGDILPTQYGITGVGGAYGLTGFGLQPPPVIQPPAAFAQPTVPLMSPPAAIPGLAAAMPSLMAPAALQPAMPVMMDPTLQMIQQQQMMQQQQQQQQQQIAQQHQQQQQLLQHLRMQQQQQMQLHQHAADLQVQLQTKELEKQVLATTLQAEMLKQQLQQLQGQQQKPQPAATPAAPQSRLSSGEEPPRQYRPVPSSYNHSHSVPPPPPPMKNYRAQGEVDESRLGGVSTLKKTYLNKANSFHYVDAEPQPPPPPPAPVAKLAAQVATVATAQSKTKTKKKGVKFVEEESEEDEEEEEDDEDKVGPPRPPSPPIPKKDGKVPAPPQPPQKKASKPQPVAPAVKAAGALVVTKAAVPPPVNSSTEMNGDTESEPMRKAPGKIGIKWPPEAEKTEKPNVPPPSRLLITEVKEEHAAIRPKQSPEEIQQKINNRIKTSQMAEMEMQVPVKKPPPPPPPAPVEKAQVEIGTQSETWSQNNMETKKKELEMMLRGVNWGTQKGKDPVAPVPPPPIPEPLVKQEEPKVMADPNRLDNIRTVLHAQSTGPFYTYKNVPWNLEIRKEVFSPRENLRSAILIDLVFAQVVADVLSGDSVRISSDDKRKMKKMLDTHGISMHNIRSIAIDVKKSIIKSAKDLPLFFSRLFPVNGGTKLGQVQMVAVSHSGVRLIARHKDVFDDFIHVYDHIKFSDIVDVHVPKSSTLLMRLSGRNIVVYSKYATHLRNMLNEYRQEENEIIPQTRMSRDDSYDFDIN